MTISADALTVLRSILNSDFQDGRNPVGTHVWTDCLNHGFTAHKVGGLIGGLLKASLITHQQDPEGDTVALTAAGMAAITSCTQENQVIVPTITASNGTTSPIPGIQESPVSKAPKAATVKANAAQKDKQKAVKAKLTPAEQAFLDGKDDAAPTPATKPAKDPLEEIGTKATKKKAPKADDLGLGEPKKSRDSELVGKKLTPTEKGLKAREGTVRGQVVKACKGGVLYPTALKRLLEDDGFKAPRSKKFADNREAYAKNRIARMVAIAFVTAE